MAKVVARTYTDENGRKQVESVDSLLRRFKKKVINEGLLQDMKDKEYYVSRGQKNRLAREAAVRRFKRNEAKRKEKEEMLERRGGIYNVKGK